MAASGSISESLEMVKRDIGSRLWWTDDVYQSILQVTDAGAESRAAPIARQESCLSQQ